ncbi:Spc98 family-domain-containing protein [Cladochytrium replicatum]|nr:Spc98 family-domain-containing protein [Cladochytrium replicatum]
MPLHEVLLAIAGHPGDIFVPSNPDSPHFCATPHLATSLLHARSSAEPDSSLARRPPPPITAVPESLASLPCCYKVPSDFDFLHPAERAALERVASLGALYSRLLSFAREPRRHISKTKDGNVGLYLMALCGGLDSILGDYLGLVVECERKILDWVDPDTAGPDTSVAYLIHAFSEYETLLPHLLSLIHTVAAYQEDYHGSRLLSLILERSRVGVPSVRTSMEMLFRSCQMVLQKQIVSWMLYGTLFDPNDEFFVRENKRTDKSSSNPSVDSLMLRQVGESRMRWNNMFVLDQSFIPDHIPLSLAQQILFVGKSMWSIKRIRRVEGSQLSEQARLLIPSLRELTELSPNKFQIAVHDVKRLVGKHLWDIMLEEQFVSHLKALKDIYLFGIGDTMTEFIVECEALVKNAGARLNLVTHYELTTLFRKVVGKTSLRDHPLMDRFRFRVLLNSEGKARNCVNPIASCWLIMFAELTTIDSTILMNEKVFGVPVLLEYDVQWPLDQIFTKEDFQSYNKMFSFLVILRKAHLRLQKVWRSTNKPSGIHALYHSSTGDGIGDSEWELPRPLWGVRNQMLFFVESFCSYVQLHIIETSYHEMLEKFSPSTPAPARPAQGSIVAGGLVGAPSGSGGNPPDENNTTAALSTLRQDLNFDDVEEAHRIFLSSVLRGSFLRPPASSSNTTGPVDSSNAETGSLLKKSFVLDTLVEALDLCDRFSGIVERKLSTAAPRKGPSVGSTAQRRSNDTGGGGRGKPQRTNSGRGTGRATPAPSVASTSTRPPSTTTSSEPKASKWLFRTDGGDRDVDGDAASAPELFAGAGVDEELARIAREFEDRTLFLFRTFEQVQGVSESARYLERLSTVLDMGKWYTRQQMRGLDLR